MISYLQGPPRHDRDFNFQRIFWPPCAIEFHNKQKYPESTKTLLTFDSSSTRYVRPYSHYQTKTFSFCHVDTQCNDSVTLYILYFTHDMACQAIFFGGKKSIARIVNAVQCHFSLSGHYDVLKFSIGLAFEGCSLYVFTLKNPPLEGVL